MNNKKVYLLLIAFFIVSLVGCGTKQNPSTLEISDDVDFSVDDYKKIVTSNNELGFKMLKLVEPDENGNSFISPLSLFIALSMVYNGADGVTKEEIAKALQSEGINVNELNEANASLITILNGDSDDIVLSVANSIWLNKDFHFKEDFTHNNQSYFNAEIQEINISNPESSKIINDWVSKATNEKITQIVDEHLDPDLVAILINAIYFKGNWMFEFDKEQTQEQTFYLDDDTTKDVQLMYLNKELSYLENEDFQAVSLPYGEGEMSMKVFLPDENSSLDELKEIIMNEDWALLNTTFQNKEGTIMLPKFQLEYEILLNETLENLGMNSAFDPNTANFSNMIQEDDPLWINKVIQKTFIDVNEVGTEAAGVTSVEMKVTSAPVDADEPFHMEVNRPFFIIITDDETDTILFMGSISNP